MIDAVFKVAIVGNQGVGKTSLLAAFTNEQNRSIVVPTVGVDFKMHTSSVDGRMVKLHLWDTSGDTRPCSLMITTSYYRAADGFLLVVDTSNLQSLHDLEGWLLRLDQFAPSRAVRLLVGVVKHGRERKVSSSAARAFAAEHGMAYEEVGEGGDARVPFNSLMRSMWDRPSALARTAAKGEVVASCCTPFATVGTFCQCWPWGWAKGPAPEPWQAVRTRSAELQVALLFRGGVVPAVMLRMLCLLCAQVCADARLRLSCAVAEMVLVSREGSRERACLSHA